MHYCPYCSSAISVDAKSCHNCKKSLDFGAISYSPDLQTIMLEITHTTNTDFVWAVIGAQSNTGQPLDDEDVKREQVSGEPVDDTE